MFDDFYKYLFLSYTDYQVLVSSTNLDNINSIKFNPSEDYLRKLDSERINEDNFTLP